MGVDHALVLVGRRGLFQKVNMDSVWHTASPDGTQDTFRMRPQAAAVPLFAIR